MNNISFGSKINVISHGLSEFQEFCSANKVKLAEMNELPVSGKRVGTGGLACCIGGNITNGNTSTAFHYTWPKSHLLDQLSESIDKLGTKLRGFIIGGFGSREPFVYSEDFADFFRKKKIDCSIIADRIGGLDNLDTNTNFFHSLPEDTYTLSVESEKQIKTVEDLAQTFKTIHIADGDTLFINGKEVPRAELEKVLEARRRVFGEDLEGIVA